MSEQLAEGKVRWIIECQRALRSMYKQKAARSSGVNENRIRSADRKGTTDGVR